MAPVAPWDVNDEQLNTLAQQLRQSRVECSALQELICKKDAEVAQFRKVRDEAERRARYEADRALALETKADKTVEV